MAEAGKSWRKTSIFYFVSQSFWRKCNLKFLMILSYLLTWFELEKNLLSKQLQFETILWFAMVAKNFLKQKVLSTENWRNGFEFFYLFILNELHIFIFFSFKNWERTFDEKCKQEFAEKKWVEQRCSVLGISPIQSRNSSLMRAFK